METNEKLYPEQKKNNLQITTNDKVIKYERLFKLPKATLRIN